LILFRNKHFIDYVDEFYLILQLVKVMLCNLS
jgi:hypothetical protein